MTSFAPGTNQNYANAYSNWWSAGGDASGRPAPNRASFGPDSPPSQGSPRGGASPYRPGMAQPIQPPSQGTPYGQPPQWDPQQRYGYGTREEWRAAGSPKGPAGAGRDRPQQSPPVAMPQWGQQQGAQQPRSDFSPWRDGQNMSRGQIHQMTYGRPFGVPAGTVTDVTPEAVRPRSQWGQPLASPPRPPFSSTMFDAFGNQTTPEQFYPQQQAMVSQIFDRLGQMDSGTYLGPGSPPPTWGRIPDFNYGEMWDQAGQMVQQGWQNPMQAPQQAWRQQHQAQIASQPNQNWLRSLSPANRRAYGLLQGLF